MSNKYRYLGIVILFLSITFLGSCGPITAGRQGAVSTVDTADDIHINTEPNSADYKRLAEKVTNKMLSSKQVQSWGNSKPRLVIGEIKNNTDDEGIRVIDIYDKIQETIFQSGLIRVLDRTANDFDYILKTELTSTRQYAKNNQELVYFTLQLKLFKIDGELIGQWSADMALAKAKRRLF
ncbi:MAG: hypothetical protein D6734_05885 [Candidatus Schekmanbacteria bacterium]|nr:MAG: hypothetical protein D6734_05885 [Candidatus Schekmanbacteria bacterium]